MELFNRAYADKTERKLKISIIAVCLAAIVGVTVLVLLGVFTTLQNATAMQIVFTVAAVIAGWTVIASVYLSMIPALRDRGRVKRLLEAEKRKLTGNIAEIGEDVTRAHFVYTKLVIESDGGRRVLYWDKNFEVPFPEGTAAEFTFVDGVVLSCSEADCEK